MIVPMAVEAFEDNLFFAAWSNVAKPKVEEMLDSIYGPITEANKHDWVNSAMRESTEFVIMMMSQMAYMKIIRSQDKYFEVLGRVYRRLKSALMKRIGDFFKSRKTKITSKRGVVAQTLFNNYGKGASEHIEVQKLQAMEQNNIINARAASAASVSALEPAAKSVDYSLDKKSIHSDLAYKKGKLLLDSFQPKAMLGAFSTDDVASFKKISSPNTGGTKNVKLDDMMVLKGAYLATASNGVPMGKVEVELALLSYYGYLPPTK